ncbi:MAG TPA: DUF2254 domain-containing protein [Acidimicrobiales bacterium]|nr:DUF2254 domain-containing protein [Acidimicrobiales bacterium]
MGKVKRRRGLRKWLHHLRVILSDREQLRTQLWLVPSVFVFAAVVLAEVMITVDERVADRAGRIWFKGTGAAATDVLGVLVTSMLAFIGVVFSISVVAVYLASTQFSPRVLRQFTRDWVNQLSLGVFSATFTYAVVLLASVEVDVDDTVEVRYSVTLAFGLTLLSLLVFLGYVHHITQSMRAAQVIEIVARETRAAIARNYQGLDVILTRDDVAWTGEPPDEVLRMREPGVIAELKAARIASTARDHGVGLELLTDVGAYVPTGARLFGVHHLEAKNDPEAEPLTIDDVWPFLEVEIERTVEDDPAFGFRQLIDVAERALSPAVNDPTTAIQVIDRLEDFLFILSDIDIPESVVPDIDGVTRLFIAAPSWDDYVHLAFRELCECGRGSAAFMRRVAAAVDRLIDEMPADRLDRIALLAHYRAIAGPISE